MVWPLAKALLMYSLGLVILEGPMLFGFRKVVSLVVLTFSLGCPALAGVDEFCSQQNPGTASVPVQRRLMQGIQNEVLRSASIAKNRLLNALICFENRENQTDCDVFHDELVANIVRQMKASKIVRAIIEKRHAQISRVSRNGFINVMNENNLKPEHIANFNIQGLSFSEEEKEQTLYVWKQAYLEILKQEITDGSLSRDQNSCMSYQFDPSHEIDNKIRDLFKSINGQFMKNNPLLAFIREGGNQSIDQKIVGAFQRLIQYNESFEEHVNTYRFDHADNAYTLVNLTIEDHEMGLLNFTEAAQSVIQRMPEASRGNACASWDELKQIQERRVRTSIGVGFGTALVCGLGVWSGIGTLPALALCLPAIGDGLLGGYRGLRDSDVAELSRYAGRSLGSDRQIRSMEEAVALRDQGKVVALVNFLGIIPIARAVGTVKLGARGNIRSLAILPTNDATVSFVEINAAKLATLIELLINFGEEEVMNMGYDSAPIREISYINPILSEQEHQPIRQYHSYCQDALSR